MPASPREEWFRRTNWSEQDRAEFFSRLARSRSQYHKAQYLRIQGYTLGEAGRTQPALELLDLLVEKYQNKSQLALAQEHRGKLLRALGDTAGAIEAFAAGERAEAAYPTSCTRCSLMFALLVVEEGLVNQYQEAGRAVDAYCAKNSELPFPIDAYHVNVIRAKLAKHQHREEDARHHANVAIEASKRDSSDFKGHPKIGLVGRATSTLHALLRYWAASNQ
jgi:tetratricopeptide (TPR) repeat protein